MTSTGFLFVTIFKNSSKLISAVECVRGGFDFDFSRKYLTVGESP